MRTLNSMLEIWSRFYGCYDFGVGFPKESVHKPTIKSTARYDDTWLPLSVYLIDKYRMKLTQAERNVINYEYLYCGSRDKKAQKLDITYGTFNTTLSNAKKKLIKYLKGT